MKVQPTPLEGVLRIEPNLFRDERGYFLETYHEERYRKAGIEATFVQDNVSRSRTGVLRGMHFQKLPHTQDKLVYVLRGEIFDAVVDLRPGSPSFARWYATRLSAEDGHQLFVPAGFAHGFCALSDEAIVAYKCSERYVPQAEQTLVWSDPDVGIDWPLADPIVSRKDAQGARLAAIDASALPPYAPSRLPR
jgi:dTDP-4-dehydrorhamnose 3,5-epimerase